MHIRTLALAGFVGTVGIAYGLDFSEFLPADIKCVSIVAPASHADNAVIEACSNELAKTGRKVKVSPGVWTHTADAAQRARYLEEAWQDPETDFILCARGGSGSWDTLRELDFSILKERDIPFMGFSNISVLMNGFVAKGVKRPISGPLCTTLVNYPNTAESLRRACATINRADLANTALTVYRAPEAAVTGKPLGGHFPSLSAMSADWLPDSTGRVIFLEVNSSYTFIEALAKFDTLKATGWFANAGAVVLCDMGIDGTDVEKEQLRQYIADAVTCPVFSGYPYGHVSKLFAIDYDRAATIAPDGTLSWESYATTLVIDAPAGTATNVTTAITGGNVSVSVNPTGAGTVRLCPDNTYLGSTTLGGGTLEAEKLAPKGEASSLGCEGDLFVNGGTLRYVGTAAATFDRAITCAAVATVENVGDLTLKGAVTSPKKVTKAGAGTLTLTSTGNNIDGSLTVDSGTLRITGGKTLANNIYVGDNTAVAGKEFWAGFEMTGGTVTLDSGTSLFVANKNKAHVTCDISGGTLTVPKNFGVGFEDDGTVKEADIVIRDKAKVVVTKGTGQRTYFYTKTKGSRTSFTIRDGATFSTSYFCRYSNSALNPTVLFDGANIVWPYDARECFGGNGTYYTLAGKIYVGPKGVAFAGGSPSYVRNFAIPLVASNTLSAAEASGVTFKTGTYEMNAAMAWEGPTTVALDATLAVGAAGSLPPSTELVLDGALAVVAGSPVAVGGARGYGTVTVYADETRETPVTAVGTYPVLTAPAAARAELEKFAATAKCGNWSTETFGYFTVAADGGTATLSLVVAGYSSEQPTFGVEGTNATSRVLFGCSFDALEKRASDGALCVKPGTTATLRAFDTEGGTFVGCWRDDTTGDILFGAAVQVTPTALTTYTAVFGKPWTFDGSNLSDGEWKFAATAKNGEISVDKPSAAPDHGVLNLATPAYDASGTRMRIVAAGTNSTANTMFGAGSNTYRKKLKTLYLGADLTTVGYGAFRNCSNLTGRVSVPPGARKLSSYAFDSCTHVVSADLSSVTNIGAFAFHAAKALVSVRLSDELKVVDRYAFNGAVKLTDVQPLFPDALEEIGRAAFYCDDGMPLGGDARMAGVKRICYAAFYRCKFTSLYLPSVTNVGYRVFYSSPATNVVFGTHRVCFEDEENKPTSSGYKGYGYQTFFVDSSITRHFQFPGLAPYLPERTVGSHMTGASWMFGKSTRGDVILHGSWRIDPEGWQKIRDEIGKPASEVVGRTPPKLREGDRSLKGAFDWYGDGTSIGTGWLFDTKMPDEPQRGGYLFLR